MLFPEHKKVVRRDKPIEQAACGIVAGCNAKHSQLTGRVVGLGEAIGGPVVHHDHTWRPRQCLAQRRLCKWAAANVRTAVLMGHLPEREVDCLAVGPQDRHAHARCRDPDVLCLEDFRRLFDHLDFLFVGARVDIHFGVVREQVEQ